jgi:hypothetical protein
MNQQLDRHLCPAVICFLANQIHKDYMDETPSILVDDTNCISILNWRGCWMNVKKILLLALIVCLLFLSSSAYATTNKNSKQGANLNDKEACYNAVVALKNTAEKAKNKNERDKLWDEIMALKSKCEKLQDHNNDRNYNDSSDMLNVLADKTALQIGYASGDHADRVTQHISLPSKGASGSTIKWTSGSPTYVDDAGRLITRPQSGLSQVKVVFFAVIQYNQATDYKTFTLTLLPYADDANRVAADKAALAIDYGGSDTAASVTMPLDKLPAVGTNGSIITWVSSVPGVVSHDGKTVNRPSRGSGDTAVVLTATLRAGSAVDTKIFVLTVKTQLTDEERIAADKAELTVGYGYGNSASYVTDNVTLKVKGSNGSEIVWVSGNQAVISNSGVVYRPARAAGDAAVTLTAIIISNGRAEYKTFTLTVKSY